jgi:hypothetical protein
MANTAPALSEAELSRLIAQLAKEQAATQQAATRSWNGLLDWLTSVGEKALGDKLAEWTRRGAEAALSWFADLLASIWG